MRTINLTVEERGKEDRLEEIPLEESDELPTVEEVLSSLNAKGTLRDANGRLRLASQRLHPDTQYRLEVQGRKRKQPESSSESSDPSPKLAFTRTRTEASDLVLVGVSQDALEADSAVDQMSRDIKALDLTDQQGDWLLPESVRSNCFPTIGTNTLLHRPEYQYLDDCVDSIYSGSYDQAEKLGNKFHVTGATGIGKSCWLARQLLQRVQEGKMVIFQPQGKAIAFMFSPQKDAEAVMSAYTTELSRKDTFYLNDSHEPHPADCMTILAATSGENSNATQRGKAFGATCAQERSLTSTFPCWRK